MEKENKIATPEYVAKQISTLQKVFENPEKFFDFLAEYVLGLKIPEKELELRVSATIQNSTATKLTVAEFMNSSVRTKKMLNDELYKNRYAMLVDTLKKKILSPLEQYLPEYMSYREFLRAYDEVYNRWKFDKDDYD